MTRAKSVRASTPRVVLGFETALLFWRAVHERRLPMPTKTDLDALPPHCLTGLEELSHVDLQPLGVTLTNRGIVSRYVAAPVTWGSHRSESPQVRPVPTGIGLYPGVLQPLHVLTGCEARRHAQAAVKTHTVAGLLPEGSLYLVADQILVVSPELAYMQCCRNQHDLPNMELALELCGHYGLMTAELPCRFDLASLTTVEKLTSCASACSRRWGLAASRALVWASDGMRSPRESELYLLLVLERSRGGFGLARPSVNASVPVAGTIAEALTRASRFEVDLVWEDERVVLEYDGLEEHEADPAKVAEDKERRSVLAAMGYTVIVVTGRDFASEVSMRAKVAQVALALGISIDPFDETETAAHTALFNWLTNPRHDHVPLGCGFH